MPESVKVSKRLSAAEAQAAGSVPPGMVWDEELQEPIERGAALMAAQLDRPLELEKHLAHFAANRVTLLKFVREYLQESEYDSRDFPIPGKLHDYYKVPGAQTKALTKLGAEKLGHLYRFGRAAVNVLSSQETPEYVSATVQVTITDQYRREIGSAVASCTTAEVSFASPHARRKYGEREKDGKVVVKADYRAALNDVVARAGKRAYVQAMIVATAADEVFVAAQADDPKPSAGEPSETVDELPADAEQQDDAITSATPWPYEGKMQGKPMKDWPVAALQWAAEPKRNLGSRTEEWQAVAVHVLGQRSKK